MKRILKTLVFGTIVLAVFFGAILLVRHRKAELANMARPAVPPVAVHLQAAATGELAITEHYLGIIEADSSPAVSPRVTGHLLVVEKDVGDFVTAGEVVARIDARTLLQQKRALKAELEGARSDLEEKRSQFDRRKQLFRGKHIPEESLDAAERSWLLARSKVQRLEEEVTSADVSLEYAVLRSPCDGVVTARQKDAGDLVLTGQPVFTIEAPAAGYKVLVKIPRETASSMGRDAHAILNFNGKKIETPVDRVHPAMGAETLATIELRQMQAPFGLPSGSVIGVDLITRTISGTRVPGRAIFEYEGKAYVFTVDAQKRAMQSEVVVLGRNRGEAIIDGTVSEGDRLIVGDESMLLRIGTGIPVRPIEDGVPS